MKALILLLLLVSPSLSVEPVTVAIESFQGRAGPFVRILVKAQNNTARSYGMVFYRCTVFSGGRAVGHQIGIISNLRPNAVAYDRISVESPAAQSATCEFDRATD